MWKGVEVQKGTGWSENSGLVVWLECRVGEEGEEVRE